MIRKAIGCSLLALILVGCDDEKEASKYEGIWLDTEYEAKVIEISNSGDTVSYKCSINDGFTQIPTEFESTSVVDEYAITTFGEITLTSRLDIQNEQLTITNDSGETTYLKRLDSIPDVCEANAIEVSYISSTDVYRNEDTTFIIDYNYRLLQSSAYFEVYFVDKNFTAYRPEENSILIVKTSDAISGSGTITVNHGSLELENVQPYHIVVTMKPHETITTYDSVLLTVN